MDEDAFEIAGVRSLRLLNADFRGSEVEQRIEVKEALDLTIPCGWIPQVIHFPGELRVLHRRVARVQGKPESRTLHRRLNGPPADLDDLRSARMPNGQQLDSIRAASARFLQLPKNYDPQIKLLAKEIGGKDGNWFVHAERVANYLKANCSYLNNNSELEPDVDSVANFLLTTKSGSCSIFASAEAILLRAQGYHPG